jgi:hypothetical protein
MNSKTVAKNDSSSASRDFFTKPYMSSFHYYYKEDDLSQKNPGKRGSFLAKQDFSPRVAASATSLSALSASIG